MTVSHLNPGVELAAEVELLILDNDWVLTVPVCVIINAGSAATTSLQELVMFVFFMMRADLRIGG